MIFSKSYCPFSKGAKKLFEDIGVKDFKAYELDVEQDGRDIQDYLKTLTG